PYHPRSTTSATTAIEPSTSGTLPRPVAARAPIASSAGTAGSGTPTCSATTRIGRITNPYRSSRSRLSRGLTIAVSKGALFRQIRGSAHRGIDAPGQRLHELHEVGALLRGEPERLHIGREPGVLHAAAIVVRDDVLERLLAAVVHVGPAEGHVSQGRCLERAAIGLVLGDGVPAQIRLLRRHADADVAIALAGEVEARVAARAHRLALEQGEPSLRRLGHRAPVAGLEAIVGRVAREDRPDVGRDGLGDPGGIELAAEDGAEFGTVDRDRSELSYQLLVRLVHVHPGLLFQRG